MTHYDVLIIGSGASGQTVAAACAKAGKSVAVVDRLPFGGTCSLRGCQPKKVLLAAAEATGRTSMLAGRGVSGACSIDWTSLMAAKTAYTDGIPDSMEGWLRDLGIDTYHDTARFTSPETMVVGDRELDAQAVVIATGARPMKLGIAGEDAAITSTDFLSLEQLPERVAFIGGGYISFEFAWLCHRAGARVTILHRSGQVLGGFDPWLVDLLVQRYRSLGIDVVTDAPVERIERATEGLVAVTPKGSVEADIVVHGAGREPDLEDLDLDTGNVAFSRRGVTVDAHLRSTSNPIVWAIGDAADVGMPLTPVAGAQGEIVAANLAGEDLEFDGSVTPSVAFTDPPIAGVGVSAAAAGEDGRLEIREYDMGGWFTQTRVGNDTGGARLVVESESGLIKGAHLLSVNADEVINILALAIKFGITLDDLRTVTWTYPTLAYDINYLTGRY